MNKQQILYARVKEDVDTEKNTYIPDIYARSNFLLRTHCHSLHTCTICKSIMRDENVCLLFPFLIFFCVFPSPLCCAFVFCRLNIFFTRKRERERDTMTELPVTGYSTISSWGTLYTLRECICKDVILFLYTDWLQNLSWDTCITCGQGARYEETDVGIV
jgi:hypothetical protein